MNAPAPATRHSGQSRPWGLIAVSAGFLAAALVIAVGLISLGLIPTVP